MKEGRKPEPTGSVIDTQSVKTSTKKAVIEHGAQLGIDVEVVDGNPGVRGFHVVKRRWVVERSIGWIVMHRRLARDYETLTAGSEAMIHVASSVQGAVAASGCGLRGPFPQLDTGVRGVARTARRGGAR